MHRRNLLVVFVLASLCSAVAASAGQPTALQQSNRNHAACPHKQVSAPQPRWSRPAGAMIAPIQVSAGGLPAPSLHRFAPDLLP